MSQQHILIVDDSPTQALKLQYALEQEGWRVTVAGDPEEALAVLGSQVLDLAVVDYFLPGMQGDELCRLIRMKMDTRNLPLLMLTVADDDSAQRKALESGADDYLPKSVDTETLLVRVRSLLRRSRRAERILGEDAYFGKGRLLVVDDSPTYRELLSELLSEEGYSVHAADGAREARVQLAEHSFDVVLVDLVMPDVDGIELCTELNNLRLGMPNPFAILMLTAHEGKEEMTRGLEAGADDFIGKSTDHAVLRARLRALLRRKFFQEENLRISNELITARAEKEAAVARAALVEQLQQANRKLKEAQVQLVHSEKMASLGQLVAGIAHELNNPLSFVYSSIHSVQEWLSSLTEEVEPRLGEKPRRRWTKVGQRLGVAREGLERMKDLVLKLRTFSRLDEGEFKVVDVHEGLESVLVLLGPRLKDRIEVRRDYCDNGVLGCLPGQLNQVMMNLISNAADAIEGEGVIRLRTRRTPEHFVLSVGDSGRGVASEHSHRVFDPFFTTKPVGQGMGLGLAISYSIVQAHQGEIELAQSEGGGAEFVVRLPLDLEDRLKTEESGRGSSSGD